MAKALDAFMTDIADIRENLDEIEACLKSAPKTALQALENKTVARQILGQSRHIFNRSARLLENIDNLQDMKHG